MVAAMKAIKRGLANGDAKTHLGWVPTITPTCAASRVQRDALHQRRRSAAIRPREDPTEGFARPRDSRIFSTTLTADRPSPRRPVARRCAASHGWSSHATPLDVSSCAFALDHPDMAGLARYREHRKPSRRPMRGALSRIEDRAVRQRNETCSTPFLVRAPGSVQTLAARSTSLHRIAPTSSRRSTRQNQHPHSRPEWVGRALTQRARRAQARRRTKRGRVFVSSPGLVMPAQGSRSGL